ncbi:hypothetical protein PIROE2DRAFT_8794 [Piromyces sp. E2]|nr:hypothetical protein PIROE2DRAFT_8794 [Piromyces sp. E2]|eukprot:OUM64406.1 hypothetical protein PIROE2DRAFT_8794 [Piromyces sp. E2]
MYNILIKHILLILFILPLILFYSQVISIDVENESDFFNLLNSSQDNLTINIDSKIIINKDCKIKNSFEKLTFIGKDKDTSTLYFSNITSQFYFTENVKEIEFKNISITGNIFFDNNININIISSSISGSINSNYEKKSGTIKLNDIDFLSSTISTDYCVNLSGNVYMDNTRFYGSSLCKRRLFNFNGLNKYRLEVTGSYFNCDYQCACMKVDKGNNVYVHSSFFDKGYVKDDGMDDMSIGGAGIRIINSHSVIQYSSFRDTYSEKGGGAFQLENTLSFIADHIDATNVTSIDFVN